MVRNHRAVAALLLLLPLLLLVRRVSSGGKCVSADEAKYRGVSLLPSWLSLCCCVPVSLCLCVSVSFCVCLTHCARLSCSGRQH